MTKCTPVGHLAALCLKLLEQDHRKSNLLAGLSDDDIGFLIFMCTGHVPGALEKEQVWDLACGLI